MAKSKNEDEELFKDEVGFKPLAPDDPLYQAIGKVASAWALFDFNVSYLIWQLAGVEDQHGACLTSNMLSINMRINTLLALLDLKAQLHPEPAKHDKRPPKDSFADFAKQIAKLNTDKIAPISKRRNRIVHDAWVQGLATGDIAQIRAAAEKKLDYGFRPGSLSQIEETHEKIQNLSQEFSKIQKRILARLDLAQMQECQKQQAEVAPQNKG